MADEEANDLAARCWTGGARSESEVGSFGREAIEGRLSNVGDIAGDPGDVLRARLWGCTLMWAAFSPEEEDFGGENVGSFSTERLRFECLLFFPRLDFFCFLGAVDEEESFLLGVASLALETDSFDLGTESAAAGRVSSSVTSGEGGVLSNPLSVGLEVAVDVREVGFEVEVDARASGWLSETSVSVESDDI